MSGTGRRLGPLHALLALLISVGWVFASAAARADNADEAQLVELEKLRGEVANEIQLAAYDLLDELVYHWTQSPPFAAETPVFVASLTVPVGLGTGLEGRLENHLAALILANPSTAITLSHCPSCTAVVVHSGPAGTVVSRGLDNPEALAKLGGPGGRHGLHIDLAAEGAWLVLRARITQLTPDLPIVWSRTLSSAVGTPSLLRSPNALKSATEARREYLDALRDRGPLTVPVRFTVRAYKSKTSTGAPVAPIIWGQTGFELALSQARSWTASAMFGYAWLPDAYDGLMVQSRMSRLISGKTRSLTGPDVYLFFGGALMTLSGSAIASFTSSPSLPPRATFGGLHIGLEFRVGNRIGASVFLENMPGSGSEEDFGRFFGNDIIDFHSLGSEVTFCF